MLSFLDPVSGRESSEPTSLNPTRLPALLLFGNSYAPEHTGIGPYTAGLAEHMVLHGWRVTVISGMPHYPQWRVEAPYRGRLRMRESLRGVEVCRVWQFVPAKQSALGRAVYEASFFAHASTHAFSPRPDCVVGIIPSLAGGAVAALAARRHNVPLGLVVQDLVGQAASQSGIPGGGLAARPASAIEGLVLRRADKVAVIADSFRPHLERCGISPHRIVHLPNWTHVAAPVGPPSAVRASLGWAETETVVLHAGNMGFKQNLEAVVEAAKVAESRRLPLRFVFMGDGNERRRLERLAASSAAVQFLDPQPEAAFMDVLAAADVLLLNERSSLLDMSLPSKITSYFRAGRPVVAAVPEGGATEAELLRSGGALVVRAGDPVALLAAIRTVTSDHVMAQRLVRCALDHADRHLDRTELLGRAERFINDLVALPPA